MREMFVASVNCPVLLNSKGQLDAAFEARLKVFEDVMAVKTEQLCNVCEKEITVTGPCCGTHRPSSCVACPRVVCSECTSKQFVPNMCLGCIRETPNHTHSFFNFDLQTVCAICWREYEERYHIEKGDSEWHEKQAGAGMGTIELMASMQQEVSQMDEGISAVEQDMDHEYDDINIASAETPKMLPGMRRFSSTSAPLMELRMERHPSVQKQQEQRTPTTADRSQ